MVRRKIEKGKIVIKEANTQAIVIIISTTPTPAKIVV